MEEAAGVRTDRRKGNGYKQHQTLCWNCARAVYGCEWSIGFKPVKGWDAEPTFLYIDKCNRQKSFFVKSCPKFIPDPPTKQEKKGEKRRATKDGSGVTRYERKVGVRFTVEESDVYESTSELARWIVGMGYEGKFEDEDAKRRKVECVKMKLMRRVQGKESGHFAMSGLSISFERFDRRGLDERDEKLARKTGRAGTKLRLIDKGITFGTITEAAKWVVMNIRPGASYIQVAKTMSVKKCDSGKFGFQYLGLNWRSI